MIQKVLWHENNTFIKIHSILESLLSGQMLLNGALVSTGNNIEFWLSKGVPSFPAKLPLESIRKRKYSTNHSDCKASALSSSELIVVKGSISNDGTSADSLNWLPKHCMSS